MIVPTFLNVGESNKVTLADLKVTGYKPPKDAGKGSYTDGCQANEFVGDLLNPNGISEGTYHWLDTGTIGPGWFADAQGTPIKDGASSVKMPSGQGLWTAGSGYQLVIPAPEF